MAESPRHDDIEPRWVTDGAFDFGADPLAIYAETYRAIADGGRRPASRRLWRTTILLVLALAFAAAAITGVRAVRPEISALLTAMAAHAPALPRPLRAPRSAYAPDVIGTTPARPKAVLRVGDEQTFAVAATGPDLHYGWTLDSVPAGTGPRWTFVAHPADLGRRRVEVVVTGRAGAERRTWSVLVRPPRPPHVVADPPPGTLEVANDAPLRLRVTAHPAAHDEHVRVTSWSVDGAPAGQGDSFTVKADRPGARTVRALVLTDLGATTTREWRVNVRSPAAPVIVEERLPDGDSGGTPAQGQPEQPTRYAARTEPAAPARPPPPPPVPARPSPPPAVPARQTEPPPPPPAANEIETAAPRVASRAPEHLAPRPPERLARDEEVRRWLERYAAAWRTHDVEMLRRMGQVTTEREAAALRAYFDSVSDLDVELNVIALRDDGDRTTVVFTRRDRFRDPAGRLVLKESPTLEKQIVRTPDGLRFARPTG